MLFKIALKNLIGARLRTFLNVFVTSISFFVILFISGMYDGMRQYAKQTTIDTEIAGGSYWHPNYCLLYTSPSPRDLSTSRMPSSA